ncbi:PREDICTED: cleavage and polyadenylation specificity factor subunit 1 isoform X2 [Camelina sativa]|uniref:Cleavage and polyadenylation specificity factor subunit 1 isoform X2 n=1 Tax=Camelina sativa TaxID=90675 RepID=A0ABM1QW97_CAMSA|nr:PREDICTED: cleavage and polyadenylation specificity factor subunit 1 isoform X2 [Camelina sativa]
MSFAAYKMMHWPTGVENCASGYITHSLSDSTLQIPIVSGDDDLEAEWSNPKRGIAPLPNVVITAANILEVYVVRAQEEGFTQELRNPKLVKRGGVMDGLSGVSLELVCHYRLHGNVESIAVLPMGGGSSSKGRDSIVLTFRDAKISVLEFDDSIHSLRMTSMHCFEGPDWLHLKRGRESFPRGPLVKVDPQGRCGGVLVYGLQMIILKASQVGSGLVGDDDAFSSGGTVSARVESSYIINLRDLEMKHVKDFVFLHGYIEPVIVILQEEEHTWAGRVSWKHHTCMLSALSINTTLKQHPVIWSAINLPHDAYKLLAVPSPIGGVLVLCANTIHYHSQSASCALALNNYASSADSSQELPTSNFSVELDAAHGTWISNDVALLSTKSGELLLLTLIYDGRAVQRLDLSKSKASVLASDITSVGNSLFFLGSRLGDSLLVQFSCRSGPAASLPGLRDEDEDIEGEGHQAKRLRISSDTFQDTIGNEELSLFGSTPNTSDSAQKSFSFAVRDSLVNVGPVKDFAYGLRINADANATGVSKQSNYELVCCSGHGKNGALCVLRQSIRPEMITEVELPGCKGIWTVYHKSSRGHSVDSSKMAADEDEYHAYLIISLEARTMVLETADLLTEVTESVDYYVQGRTIAAGNLFGRRRVIQVFEHGARILDGSFMNQELSFGAPNSESNSGSESSTVSSVSIADPYVLLRMTDDSIRLLVGDPSTCTVSISSPSVLEGSKRKISACTLYHDKGPEPWLRKASTDAWLSSGVGEVDSADGGLQDQGDIYCVLCYESGALEIFDVPSFNCVFSVDKFASGRRHLCDMPIHELEYELNKSSEKNASSRNEEIKDTKVVELAMQRWSGHHTRPFLFAVLADGTILCYHAYLFEGVDSIKAENSLSSENPAALNSSDSSKLRNLKFLRIPLDTSTREETSDGVASKRITMFKNINGHQGFFLSGSRPGWCMLFRERLRFHSQLCDGSIAAFTVLHNVNCNHGFIYVTSQGVLKICQLPSVSIYDNYWPVQKIPLKATPHQVTYYAEKNLYPLIVSYPVSKPLNQVLSSLVDQEAGQQIDNHNLSSDDLQRTYTVEEFEIRILEPERSGGPWETKATIPMQSSEHALTVRVVTLLNASTGENETLLAVGTAYVQGEDVAARGRVLLFSFGKNGDNSQNVVTEVYSKELKGAISAVASIQGHLLISSGPKINLHKWNGTDLNSVAFYDAPPLYVVSMNVVKNFILLGDVHQSIYFLSWKEQGSQLTLLAKDFGSLDCFATEFLIDGSTLSLAVSDEQKNVQLFDIPPDIKVSKLLSLLSPLVCT